MSIANLFKLSVDYFCASKINKLRLNHRRALKSYYFYNLPKIFLPYKFKTKTFFGCKFFGYTGDPVSMSILSAGFFEKDLTASFIRNVKPGDTVIDIGAQLGYYTLLASRIVTDRGSVHAFEPTELTFKNLMLNTEGLNNVKLNNIAVSNEIKNIQFYDFGPMNSAFNSIYKQRTNTVNTSDAKKVVIECTTIDKYVEEKNIIPNIIKIDAEGSELDILNGSVHTLSSYKPIIYIEIGDVVVDFHTKTVDIINYLKKYNYNVYEVNYESDSLHTVKEYYNEPSNLLFL